MAALKQLLKTARFNPIVPLAAVGLLILGQWLWFENLTTVRPGGIAVLAGIVLLLWSFRSCAIVLSPQEFFRPLDHVLLPWNWKIPFALMGIGLCVYVSHRAIPDEIKVWDVFILWGTSIGLAIYGLVPHDDAIRWRASLGRSLRHQWRIWLLIGALFVLGLIIRTAWLETYPYIQAGDEAQFAYEAAWLRSDRAWAFNPFAMGIWHHPRTYHALIGIAIEIFGQTKIAARMPSAIFGALTVPAVYVMGRQMFDHRIGLLAAIFMVAFPVHVQFSRTGMDQTGDPFFAALALAFLTRALRKNSLMDAAIAGLTMGLSQYFYFAGKIVPVICLGYVGLYALVNFRAIWRRTGVLLVTLIVAGVVVFPSLYSSYEDKERSLSPRLDQVSIWATGNIEAAKQRDEVRTYWTNQIQHAYLAYVQVLDESDVYGKYNPVMGWFAGVPLLLGLVVVLQHWRDPRFIILLAWIIGTATLGGLLLVDPPHYPRYISATPALALLVSLGLVAAGAILRNLIISFSSLSMRLPFLRNEWALPVLLALSLSAGDLITYVVDYTPRKILYGETTQRLNEVVDILDTLDGQYTVWYFSSLRLDLTGTDLIRYLTPENAGKEYVQSIDELAKNPPTHGPHAFVIAPERFDEVAPVLLFEVPGGELREYINERTYKPLVYVYFVDVP